MSTARPGFLLIAATLLLAGASFAQKTALQRAGDLEHMREELGINQFTAPAISILLDELDALKPLPFDKAWRDLPESSPQDRARLALSAGQVIADGFLAVTAEKQSRIEPVGRALIRFAKGLGVGDHVTKHSKSIIELAARERWPDLKRELSQAQAEVEAGMMALKDEEIAHLVSLGGWLRGLEITSTVVHESYTPERARRLAQPELFDYFIDRVDTLNPNLKKTPLVALIGDNLKAIRKLAVKPADAEITADEVKQIRDLARAINKAIATPEQ